MLVVKRKGERLSLPTTLTLDLARTNVAVAIFE